MFEFQVNGIDYRARPIDVREQNRVVRRILPLVAAGIAGLTGLQEAGEKNILKGVQPFADTLGNMSDADADYVINACLRTVQRKLDGDRGWSQLTTQQGDLMYEDVDLAQMYQIVFAVAQENLGGFFGALQSISPGLMQKMGQNSSTSQTETITS